MSSDEKMDKRSLSVETQFEVRPRDAVANGGMPAKQSGLGPMVTQPFDAWVEPSRDPAHPPALDLARTTLPFGPGLTALRSPEIAPPTARAQPAASAMKVSVARVEGVGQPALPPVPAPAPSLKQAQSFQRTVIAAGHRAPVVAPLAPAPVPAYPPYRPEERSVAPAEPPAAATPAPEPAPRQRPELRHEQAVTTSVDIKDLLTKFPVHMPERGGSEPSSSSWSTASEPVHKTPLPDAQAAFAQSEDDVPVPQSGAPRKPLLLILGMTAALGLMGTSFLLKRSSQSEPAVANEPPEQAAAPAAGVPPPAAAEATQQAPEEHAEERKPEQAPEPPAQHAVGSVTQASAAELYINGQYKEALAEYRLLSRAYPREAVYGELARILRRKLIDTCERTQPNRTQACKDL